MGSERTEAVIVSSSESNFWLSPFGQSNTWKELFMHPWHLILEYERDYADTRHGDATYRLNCLLCLSPYRGFCGFLLMDTTESWKFPLLRHKMAFKTVCVVVMFRHISKVLSERNISILVLKRKDPFLENSLARAIPRLEMGLVMFGVWSMLEDAGAHPILRAAVAEIYCCVCPLGGGTLYQNTACRSRKSDVGCCWPVFLWFNYNKASRWEEQWKPLGQKVGVGMVGSRGGGGGGIKAFEKFTESYLPPWLYLWCSSLDMQQLFIMPFTGLAWIREFRKGFIQKFYLSFRFCH